MRSTVAFVALAFAVSWLLWAAAAAAMGWDLSQRSGGLAIAAPLYLLGVWAPAFVALALTAYADGRAGVSALLRGMLKVSVQARWYLFAVGYFVSIKFGVALLQRATAGEWPAFNPEPWFVMMAAVPFSTPIQAGEEIGWRGYLLPRLSARVGMPVASLMVGVIWACWHLPFFVVAGADTSGQPFLPYLLSVTALSVAMAWLYWRTQGSLLLVMLMHAAVNNMNPLAPSVAASTGILAITAPFVAWGTAALLGVCAMYFLFAMRGQRRAEMRPTQTPPAPLKVGGA